MTKIYLVRHGTTGVPWSPIEDAPLNGTGREQALVLAESLKAATALNLISSPYRRARETAAPLARFWKSKIVLSEEVREIPSPMISSPSDWLTWALKSSWPDLGRATAEWKSSAVDFLKALQKDSIVFTHYLTITAIISEITGNEKVDCFNQPNCSLTKIEINGANIQFRGAVSAGSLA